MNTTYSEWLDKVDGSNGLYKKRLRKKVSVPPSYLNTLRLACQKILDHQLNKYNEDLNGTIVSYNPTSIRPTTSTTSLQNSPADAYINFTIQVDIILFAPKPGTYLSGECTEITGSYISCIVCDIFNCTIPLIDHEGVKLERNIYGGEVIKFKLDKLEVDKHGLLVLKGNPNDMSPVEHTEMQRG